MIGGLVKDSIDSCSGKGSASRSPFDGRGEPARGARHDPHRRRRQRAQPLAPCDSRPRGLDAHRAPRRSAEVLHGLGGLPRQRARRSMGDAHRREIPASRAQGDHRRQRREVAGLRRPSPRPSAHRRPRRRGRPAPARRRRSRRAPASHGRGRHRHRGDLSQQGPRHVGDARSRLRDGAMPRVQRLGARDVQRVPRPHGAGGGARHR